MGAGEGEGKGENPDSPLFFRHPHLPPLSRRPTRPGARKEGRYRRLRTYVHINSDPTTPFSREYFPTASDQDIHTRIEGEKYFSCTCVIEITTEMRYVQLIICRLLGAVCARAKYCTYVCVTAYTVQAQIARFRLQPLFFFFSPFLLSFSSLSVFRPPFPGIWAGTSSLRHVCGRHLGKRPDRRAIVLEVDRRLLTDGREGGSCVQEREAIKANHLRHIPPSQLPFPAFAFT